MEADSFIRLAERLTGTPVKELTPTDREILGNLLVDESRSIGHSQLNELLLLVNKDRMERPFFDYFFAPHSCAVSTLESGVLKFQKAAMLRFGNFIHAYRVLSRSESLAALEAELAEWAALPADLERRFADRSPKLVDIELIPREHTSLVGYISAGEVVAEDERCRFLRTQLPPEDDRPRVTWQDYEKVVLGAAGWRRSPSWRICSRTIESETPLRLLFSLRATSTKSLRCLLRTPNGSARSGNRPRATRTFT